MAESPPDPDRWCLAIVQQWLAEQGFTRALAALEQEACLKVQNEVQRGSQLLQLVYDHIEQLAAETVDEAATARRLLEEQLLAGGSACGPGDCPGVLRASLEEPHASANVIAVQCWPQRRLAISGSSDGSVRLIGYDGGLVWEAQAGRSGVLCLALHLASSASSTSPSTDGSGIIGSSLVAAGLMDGSVVVLDAVSGTILARSAPHRKYVVDALWAPGGRHLVTASWDCSFAVHRLQRRQAAGGQAAAVEAGGGSNSGGSSRLLDGGEWELVMVHHEQTAAKVNSLELLPPLPNNVCGGNGGSEGGSCGEGASSCRFLVAVQGSNYLREISISTAANAVSAPPGPGWDGTSTSGTQTGGAAAADGAAAGSLGGTVVVEERRINLNPAGDDHVSFSAAYLALSPCARLLLVSADNGRLLVYERVGWTQLRSIIGLPVEQFHQYIATWHRSGQYIMAAAAHGGVCLFHVGSARRVATLAAHSKNVRGLAYDAPNNLLLTCSFDRTVKVWEAAGAAECEAGAQEEADQGTEAGAA